MPRTRDPAAVRAALVRRTYRLGWRYGGRLPSWLVRRLIPVAARVAVWKGGPHLDTLRANLAATTGRPAGDTVLRAGVASYLRTFWEVLALPSWPPADVVAQVRVDGVERLAEAYAGPGAVVVLPHSGNWDLAGAWACLSGYPVTTVAEQLPAAEFAAFVGFRESLGMEVLSHRDPNALTTLVDAVSRGRVVCLIADRDLAGSGLPVDWAGHAVTLPAGPALVARRSGAVLLPGVCQYAGDRMVIRLGDAVQPRPGRDGLRAMTQQVADFFSTTIAGRPEDWHMLQPFFTADRSGAVAR